MVPAAALWYAKRLYFAFSGKLRRFFRGELTRVFHEGVPKWAENQSHIGFYAHFAW